MSNADQISSMTRRSGANDPAKMPPHARNFRVNCFRDAERWFNRLIRLMRALHEGFWLGCLSADDLNAVTARHFDESQYYASTEHNLSGFFDWELPILDRYFRRGSRILVAGAGGGREVLALRKAGFDAEGFECSLPLVRTSEKIVDQQGEASFVIHCPPDSVPSGPAIYSGLIVGWSAYTHIPTRLRRVLFLQALRKRALPQSPILISFFTRDAGSWDENILYRTATLSRFFLRGRNEPLERGDHLEFSRYLHRFTREEAEAELKTAGFRVAHYGEEGDPGHAVGIAE